MLLRANKRRGCMVVRTLYGLPFGNHRYYSQHAGKAWHMRGGGFDAGRETDIYVSSSAWLNPADAFDAGCSWKHSRHILLRQDLVLDFDSKDLSQVERALGVLGSFGHTRFLFVNTRSGFHLWDLSFGDTLAMPENVFNRMSHAEKEQRSVLGRLENEGVRLDYAASEGCKRIFRVPGSWHSGGVQCAARPITLAGAISQPDEVREAHARR